MKLGMVGLGRMGANMAERLVRAGHQVLGFDPSAEAMRLGEIRGVMPTGSLETLATQLAAPRTIWLMVPSGDPVDDAIHKLVPALQENDVVIDGGNSYYKDSQRRAAGLRERRIHFLDVGTSGGIWGLAEGYCMMIGGDPGVVDRLRPIFESLAPASDKGWGHVGPPGSGHFVKMIHNGIEYGMMEALAEGFELMGRKNELNLDLARIAELWRHGSVIRSWLLDLIAQALKDNPQLQGIAPFVAESGEGRWTVLEALDARCAIPAIQSALNQRFLSQDEASFGLKLLAALRHQFGGHPIKTDR